MAHAFRILGYKVCDYVEQLLDLQHSNYDYFDSKLNPEQKKKHLQTILEDFDVVLDAPFYFIWKELSEAFPEAKVIFWERDIDSWYKSWKKQLDDYVDIANNGWPDWVIDLMNYTMYPKFHALDRQKEGPLWPLIMSTGKHYYRNWYGKKWECDEVVMKRIYRQHCADVKLNCPKEKLLILDGPDCGWKVVCDFLGVAAPEGVEWPYMNKGGKLVDELFMSSLARIPTTIAAEKAERKRYFVKIVVIGAGAVALYKYRNDVEKIINENVLPLLAK